MALLGYEWSGGRHENWADAQWNPNAAEVAEVAISDVHRKIENRTVFSRADFTLEGSISSLSFKKYWK
jgi:hypothetical protein